jgi:hypothetical protein
VFRDSRGAVCSAATGGDVLKAFGSLATFNTFFGGQMTFGWPPSENLFVGVWGDRNASRFRRILRERLGEQEVVHRPPPERLVLASTVWRRPSTEERLSLERLIEAVAPTT